jgi:SNF2 family DNA or RNA helicase
MTGAIFTPRAYGQLITGHILDVDRPAVWAGMGLGKTVSTLNALDMLQLADDRPVLVLAPLRVARSTWPDEARKWAHLRHLRVTPIVGGERERLSALKHDANIYTTNYEQLPWLIEHYEKRAWPFATVVVDESTKLKGFRLRQGTQRAKALASVAHTKVKRFIELTGTPSPNGLADLWGQIWFLDKGRRLGTTYDAFRQRWFEKSYDGYSITPKDHAQGQIQAALRDLCVTIDAKDWFDLREPVVTNIYVDLPAKARALYEDMEKRMFMELEEHQVEAFGAAARTVKCLQLAQGCVYVGESNKEWREVHDAKLEALDDIIEESAGMPVLVAYNFKSDLARLHKAFPKGRQLDSDPQTIVDWNAGKIPVLFAHPASAGHGLNLQDGGNILVFFGHDWNLENRLQIIERIGPTRQMQAGHDRAMFIYNIIARDTVDEMVIERVNTKREVQDILLDAMKVRGYR